MAKRLRSIVREWDFEEQLERLLGVMEEADEFTNAAELLLARDPEAGERIGESDVWTLHMPPVKGRTVYLYYAFNAQAVHFLAILAIED